jgi:hypothetical protein
MADIVAKVPSKRRDRGDSAIIESEVGSVNQIPNSVLSQENCSSFEDEKYFCNNIGPLALNDGK